MDYANIGMTVPQTPVGYKPRGQVGQMASAVDQLEALFQRAESDLSYVHRKLDTQLSAKYETIGHGQLNPLSLIARIAALKTTMTEVSDHSKQLWAEKQDVADRLQRILVSSGEGVRDLQQQCGIEGTGPSEDEQAIIAGGVTGGAHAAAVGGEGKGAAAGGKIGSSAQGGGGGFGFGPRSTGPTRSKKVYIPVSQDEFESVSDLVRGRVKLAEVNQVYEALHTFFRKQKKTGEGSASLSTKEMAAMGLKITGATGEARLKVLRQLKLVNISNRDKSVMLNFE